MTNHPREDRRAALTLALLRATLLVVILVSEQLVDANQLVTSGFFVVLGIGAVYSLAWVVFTLRRPIDVGPSVLQRRQSVFDFCSSQPSPTPRAARTQMLVRPSS